MKILIGFFDGKSQDGVMDIHSSLFTSDGERLFSYKRIVKCELNNDIGWALRFAFNDLISHILYHKFDNREIELFGDEETLLCRAKNNHRNKFNWIDSQSSGMIYLFRNMPKFVVSDICNCDNFELIDNKKEISEDKMNSLIHKKLNELYPQKKSDNVPNVNSNNKSTHSLFK